MCVRDGHVELSGRDAAAFHAFEGQRRAGFERSQRIDDGGLIRASIRQRAHQHVAADPGECVQIAEQGHSPFIMLQSRSPACNRVRDTKVENPSIRGQISNSGKAYLAADERR
jgi:hypothetical protein